MRRPARKSLACAVSWLLLLPACGVTSQERVLYQASGVQVGIETDLSTNERAMPPVKNNHPVALTPQEIRSLLGSLEVSGWSGAIVGLFSAPQPKALFTWAELVELAEPLAAAFHEVGPGERVFFSLQNPNAPYDSDRTSGSLFFRDDYLHVGLTDHYGFLQADPGGGETRDPRDTKGMKLWVVAPAQAATVPENKEPHWNAFEKVHISLNPREVLVGQRLPQAAGAQPASKTVSSATDRTESVNDLRLQIREVNNANLDLRSQLKEQSDTIQRLQFELEELRNEKKPGPQKPASSDKPPRTQTRP
jgi:FtsZ-binding cell division protein ZapB